jgi:hypothetical protein
MHQINFCLPTGECVTLLAVGIGPNPFLYYLHKVRRDKATETDRLQYENMLPTHAKRLATFVAQIVPDAEALVVPLSSRDDTSPYLKAILEKQPSLLDLSAGLSRRENLKAGDNRTSLEDMIDSLAYKPTGYESKIKSILIVDETVGTGKTAAAILHHLRASGLAFADKCRVTIVTALKVQ